MHLLFNFFFFDIFCFYLLFYFPTPTAFLTLLERQLFFSLILIHLLFHSHFWLCDFLFLSHIWIPFITYFLLWFFLMRLSLFFTLSHFRFVFCNRPSIPPFSNVPTPYSFEHFSLSFFFSLHYFSVLNKFCHFFVESFNGFIWKKNR